MKYFVTGATGFLGSHLIDRLVTGDHRVTALTRDPSNADHLPEAVTVVEGDITDKGSMRDAMEGVDGVFHLAAWFKVGPGPWNVEKAERINVDGTRTVFELMEELDVPKGVYISTTGVYGNTGGKYVDESYRSPNTFPSVYQRTKWKAHYEVAEPMMEAGLPLVITTLGGIYGPGDKDYGGYTRTAVQDYLQGALPLIPSDLVLPWEHVEDSVTNLERAMDEGDPGEEYIIANEPRNLAEIFDIAEEITGVPAPRSVPGRLFYWLSRGVAVLELVARPPEGFESELLEFLASGGILVDNSKAKRELGIEHRPLDEGLHDYLMWEMEQLGMSPRTTERAEEETTTDTAS